VSESSQTIDRDQLRLLLRTSIKLAWRGSTNPFTAMKAKKGKFPGFLVILLVNAAFSILFGMVVYSIPDLFAAIVLSSIGPLVLVSMQVLMEFSGTIVSPDDYQILSPHPVNSRTYFMAKLTYLLLYVSVLSISVSILPAIMAIAAHKNILAGAAVMIIYWIVNIFSAGLMMNIFTLALRTVDRRRMEHFMGYVQFVFILVYYLGFNLLPRALENFVKHFDIESMGWLKALPGYWYASWIKLLSRWNTETFLWGMLGIAALFALGKLALSYLSLGYSESLARLGESKKTKQARRMPVFMRKFWNGITSYEERAVMTLVRAQFKNDIHFRLQIFSILPVFILAIIIGFREGFAIRDPFAHGSGSGNMIGVLFALGMGLIPYAMHFNIQYSASWRAAWIFYSAPVDRLKIVLAVKHLIIILFFIPIGILLTIVLAILFHNVLHALLQVIFMFSVAILGLTVVNSIMIRLPFSVEKAEGSRMPEIWAASILGIGVVAAPIIIVSIVGYHGYIGWAIIVAAFVIINLLLTRFQNMRIRDQIESWEFAG
jgi:ABC-2 type transport system permease protein